MAIEALPRKSRSRVPSAVPGDTGLPLLGHTLSVLKGTYYTDRTRYDRYGPVTRMNAFGMKAVMVQGPDGVGEVLQNRDHAFASGPGWSYLIGPFFRRGLMLLDFDEHHAHKRIMQQAFTTERLTTYLDPMNDVLGLGLDGWIETPDLKIYKALKQLTLDVATRTFMGAELGTEADELNRAFSDCVRAGTAILRFPMPGLRWSRGLSGRRRLEAYLYPQIPAKRAGAGTDLFSALCQITDEDGNGFSDDDIVNHMIFLLMAAHDTTTITMTTMAYYLATHPEWQERVRAESVALGKDAISFTDQEELVSLDLVMKECMRLVTAVPGVARRTVKPTQVLGIDIPADTFVSCNFHGTHMLDEYWPEPTKFDPERFSAERHEDKVHRNAWIPFGNGVHKCIGLYFGGMQVKAAMHQLLLRYRWSVPDGYVMPVDWSSLPRPKDGLPVHLERV
ncbi:cytochrome P450 [Jatrophihabitans sp.]|uniref:cytochrome P450 n=1 Tax=Jatrophihabitans sp. TaxID=1932789 RepID=UPI0030C6C2D7|nr:cytochrome [Jatrophihabitans sp.]